MSASTVSYNTATF